MLILRHILTVPHPDLSAGNGVEHAEAVITDVRMGENIK